jgi:DNA-binding MarR family transcriptional regulator
MITKHDDLLGTLVHDVAHLLRHEIDRRLQPYNLTRAKWLALGIIANRPHLTQSELAVELELGNAAVGRLIDRLIGRGFIVREDNPDDRRAYRLVVTEEATELLKELEAIGSDLRSDLLAPFSEHNIKQLNSGLTKLKKQLKATSAAALSALMLMPHKSSLGLLETLSLTL